MTTLRVDRAALVRRSMVELVADHGIHGTSMSQIADHAGVATGTAYVHYESKNELLIASFVEVKLRLGLAAVATLESDSDARAIFDTVWRNIYSHLVDDPAVARFLVQVEVSPLRDLAHQALGEDDPLTRLATDLSDELVDLPAPVMYDLSLAPAVRLVASGTVATKPQLTTIIESCWRSIEK